MTCTPVPCVCCVSCRPQPPREDAFSFRGILAGVCVRSCASWKSRQRGRLRPSRAVAGQQAEMMITDGKEQIMKLIRHYFFRPNGTSFAFRSNTPFSILFPNILNPDSFLKYREELPYQHKQTSKINSVRFKYYITVHQTRKKIKMQELLPTGGLKYFRVQCKK